VPALRHLRDRRRIERGALRRRHVLERMFGDVGTPYLDANLEVPGTT